MVKVYLLREADADKIEAELDGILGLVGKYCQPEMGQAVRKIRKTIKDREMNVY